MTYDEFRQNVYRIEERHRQLCKDEIGQLATEYLSGLPFEIGDRIRYFRPQGWLEGVVEDIIVRTVPGLQVEVKLKHRKPTYEINPERVEVLR